MVGEASYALATACYGNKTIGGDSGHDNNDVLYLVFPGLDAVPGPDGVAWNASNYTLFEQSIEPLGDKIVLRVPENPVPVSTGSRLLDDSDGPTFFVWAVFAISVAVTAWLSGC
jgi:hypothetical protein